MLTKAKRAEIRARTEDSAREIKESKKTNILVIEDQEEMLAAAEAIPASRLQQQVSHAGMGDAHARHQQGRKRPREAMAGERQRAERGQGDGWIDPLTAWFQGCYFKDDYAGHVADLRNFLRGIDFLHVSPSAFPSRYFSHYCSSCVWSIECNSLANVLAPIAIGRRYRRLLPGTVVGQAACHCSLVPHYRLPAR